MKRKLYDDVAPEEIKLSEREAAINSLGASRAEVDREIEELLRSYARLAKKSTLARRKGRHGERPNAWKPREKS